VLGMSLFGCGGSGVSARPLGRIARSRERKRIGVSEHVLTINAIERPGRGKPMPRQVELVTSGEMGWDAGH
jgi:hypothetical protein